jgi:hypothetical protein
LDPELPEERECDGEHLPRGMVRVHRFGLRSVGA